MPSTRIVRSFHEAEALYDTLVRFMRTPPTIRVIQGWSKQDFHDVEHWAWMHIFQESGKDLGSVPAKPQLMEKYR